MIYYKITYHNILYIITINHDSTPLYLFWSFRNVGLREVKSVFGPQGFWYRQDLPPRSTAGEEAVGGGPWKSSNLAIWRGRRGGGTNFFLEENFFSSPPSSRSSKIEDSSRQVSGNLRAPAASHPILLGRAATCSKIA